MSRLSGATGGITTGVATGALALLSAGGLATLALIGSVAPAGLGPGLPSAPFAVASPPAVQVTPQADVPRAADEVDRVAAPVPTSEVVPAVDTDGADRERPELAGAESTPTPSASSTPVPSVIAEPVASVAPVFASIPAATPAATQAAQPDTVTKRRGRGHAYGRPDFAGERAKPHHTLPPVAAPTNVFPLPTPAAAPVPVPSPAPGLAVTDGHAHGHGLGLGHGSGNPHDALVPVDGSGVRTGPGHGNPSAPEQLHP